MKMISQAQNIKQVLFMYSKPGQSFDAVV